MFADPTVANRKSDTGKRNASAQNKMGQTERGLVREAPAAAAALDPVRHLYQKGA
jgi:hypothetical protein